MGPLCSGSAQAGARRLSWPENAPDPLEKPKLSTGSRVKMEMFNEINGDAFLEMDIFRSCGATSGLDLVGKR
jgi:hypothetical protein